MQKCHATPSSQPTNPPNEPLSHVESVSAVETASERMISSIIYDAVGIIHHNIYKRIPLFHVLQSSSGSSSSILHRIGITPRRSYIYRIDGYIVFKFMHVTIDRIFGVCAKIYRTGILLTENRNMSIVSLLSIQCPNWHQ